MRTKDSHLLLIFLVIVLLLAIFPAGSKQQEMKAKQEVKADWKLETARRMIEAVGLDLSLDEDDVLLFGTSFTIAEDETLKSDVLIIGGGLAVEGVLYGDAVIIGGSIYLASSAIVKGEVTTIGGIIEREEGAVVERGLFELEYPSPLIPPHPAVPKIRIELPESTFYLELPESLPPTLPSKQAPEEAGYETKRAKKGEDIVRLGTDIHIAKNEIVKGDVVAVGGDILVEGKVEGDVVSIGGDISITSDANIEGDVLTSFGKIEIKPGAKVSGDIVEQSWEGTRTLKAQAACDTTAQRKHRKVSRNLTGELDYNRVDGLYLGLLLSDKKANYPMPRYEFKGGYSFKRERWLYDFKIEQPLIKSPMLSAGVHIYDMTESNDDDIVSDAENLFATSLLKKDYRDYFDLRGAEGFVAFSPRPNQRLQVSYSEDEYRPLETKAHASILRKKRDFEPNPTRSRQICEGDSIDPVCKKIEINAMSLSYQFDSRPEDLIRTPDRGTLLEISGEWTRKNWGSSYSYNRYSAEVRKYVSVSSGQQVSFRLKLGLLDVTPEKSSRCRHRAEPQYFFPKEFYVGGIGTLPGYDYKQFRGTHMVLFNSEYAWQLGNRLSALLLFDAGDAKGAIPIDEWKRGALWQALKLKLDAGIGLRYEDPGEYSIMLAMVKRLVKFDAEDEASPVLIVRATRMF